MLRELKKVELSTNEKKRTLAGSAPLVECLGNCNNCQGTTSRLNEDSFQQDANK